MTLPQLPLHNHHSTFTTLLSSLVKLPSSCSSSSSSSSSPFSFPFGSRHACGRLQHSGRSYASHTEKGGGMGIEVLEEFIQLNRGSWTGSFTQFDALGNALQFVPTRLSANSYGRGEQVSLYQTLNIKQAPPKTVISGEENAEMEWAEYKLGETNIFTVDKPQQVGYFPSKRAYMASHQTAEMLDCIIRAGVLGEDGDDLEESPPDIKLPSRRPALVCESCLYAKDGDNRMRAFHVLDPRGILDFIGVFQERKENGSACIRNDNNVDVPPHNGSESRLDALLGRWEGHSITRRTGIYGSTVVEEDMSVAFKLEDDGTLLQDISSSRGSLHLRGSSNGGVVKFEKGLQMTLLPGGMALTSPINVGRSVGHSQAFYFEFSWIYSPGKRQRLVRTYDTDGLVVSTTFVEERKL